MRKINSPQRILIIVIILLAVSVAQYFRDNLDNPEPAAVGSKSTISALYQQQRSNVQVSGTGTVVKVLADDLKGARHQKFILRVDDGLTVLVAHNIDLASKVKNLQKGDEVSFSGEYEYNHQGGVIHWTHHSPNAKHPDGWLKHDGKIYQ